MTVLRPFANPAVRSPRRRAGFTIVELLVVISVIAILISLLSVGIVQAGGTARQTKALSGLKQIGTAWSQYAAQNEDRAMPGYMDDGVQAAFKIKVRNAAGDRVDPQFCRTYPFRLLPFLDNERTILYDYLTDYEEEANIPDAEIAANPAYGYNAYYIGGWYTTIDGAPRMRFSSTGYFKSPGNLVPNQEMVARATTQIQRTSDMIVFGSSYTADPGFYKNADGLARGAAWINPHTRGITPIWASSDGLQFDNVQRAGIVGHGLGFGGLGEFAADFLRTSAPSAQQTATLVQGNAGIQVFQTEAVPLRRYKNTVPTVRADNSTQAQGLRDLMSQVRWMNHASFAEDAVQFSHPE